MQEPMDLTKKKNLFTEETQKHGNGGGTSLQYNQAKIIIFDSILFLMQLPDELILQYRGSIDQLILNIRLDRLTKFNLTYETSTLLPPHPKGLAQDTLDSSSLLSESSGNVVPRYSPVTPEPSENMVPRHSTISAAETNENSSTHTATPHTKPAQTPRHMTTPHLPPAQSESATPSKKPPTPEMELHKYLNIPTLVEVLNRAKDFSALKSFTDLGLIPNLSPYYMGQHPHTNHIANASNSMQQTNQKNRMPIPPFIPPFPIPYTYMPNCGTMTTSINVRPHPSATECESSLPNKETRHSSLSSTSKEQNNNHKSNTNFLNMRSYPSFFDPRLFYQHYRYVNTFPLPGTGQSLPHVGTTSTHSISSNPSSTENSSIPPNPGATYFNQLTLPVFQTPNLRPYTRPSEYNSQKTQKGKSSNLLKIAISRSQSVNVSSKDNSLIKPHIQSKISSTQNSDPRLKKHRVRTVSSASSEEMASSPREHNSRLSHEVAHLSYTSVFPSRSRQKQSHDRTITTPTTVNSNVTLPDYTPRLPYQDVLYPCNPPSLAPSFANPKNK